MTHDQEVLNVQGSGEAEHPKTHHLPRSKRPTMRLLRFEMLETRRLMAGDLQLNVPITIADLLSPTAREFGENTLPATDVAGDLPTGSVLNAAAPWTGASSSPFHGPSIGPTHTPSLEAGVLGNFAQLWRGSYGAITDITQENEKPADKEQPERPQAGLDVDEVLDVLVANRIPKIGVISDAAFADETTFLDEPVAIG